MNRILVVCFGLALATLALEGCVYKKKAVTPTTPTDTTQTDSCETLAAVTYADVASIFTARNCISCHEAGVSGPKLADHATFQSYIQSNEATFKRAINHQNSNSLLNMPQGESKLPDAEIKTIETWICQGMNH